MCEYECMICGKKFNNKLSLMRHVAGSYGKEKEKQHCPALVYQCEYEKQSQFSKTSLQRMYLEEMKSTPMMADELGISKKSLIDLMHYYDIELRNFGEATVNQIKRDGLWNKGKTKYDHPSIMKYANSRRGKNNPYFTAPGFEDRQRKSRERFLGIHRQQCHNRTPQSTEGRMINILDAANLQYLRNFCIRHPGGTWRLYDFLVEGVLIIEMQGNYYHANPKMYDPDDTITIARSVREAKDIWAYDADKKKLGQQTGYGYLVLWEDEFIAMRESEVLMLVKTCVRDKE